MPRWLDRLKSLVLARNEPAAFEPRVGQTVEAGDEQVIYEELTSGQSSSFGGMPRAPIVRVTDVRVTTLSKRVFTTYEQYRRIRKDPTVALCRAVLAGPILSSQWAVKGRDEVDEDWVQFITDQMLSKRYGIMEPAIYGQIDFGWQGFEKVFEVQNDAEGNRRIGLKKLKPLLQDMTAIMVMEDTGEFAGFEQSPTFIEYPAKAVLLTYRPEGTMWHGNPLLEDARESVEKWNDVEVGAARYDRKMAGSHIAILYPPGKSSVGGAWVDNATIASSIISAIESCGSFAIPSSVKSLLDGVEGSGGGEWKIEIIESKGPRQASFVDRARYLDACKVRAMHIPERAILEGQYGTKADAEGHGDVMTVMLENLDYQITDAINAQVVDHLLELNFGKEARGTVWLESPPLADSKIGHMRKFMEVMLANPSGFMEIFPFVDYGVLMDQIGIPKSKEVVRPDETPEAPQPGVDPKILESLKAMGMTPGKPAPLKQVVDAMKDQPADPLNVPVEGQP